MSENVEANLSRATFYRLRPKHVCLSNFLKNKNYLCQIHQNTVLMLQAIKKALPVTESKPRTMGAQHSSNLLNQAGVTIHPCVVCYKHEDEGLKHTKKHKSVAYLSDCNHHNSGMVFAILRSLHEKELKSLIDERNAKFIHYITGSPYSQ